MRLNIFRSAYSQASYSQASLWVWAPSLPDTTQLLACEWGLSIIIMSGPWRSCDVKNLA